jgi:hypothetical protein
MSTARILVTGSRTWPDPQLLADTLLQVWHDALEAGHDGIVIVHGGADGADLLAETWAIGNSVPYEAHPADWDTCGPDCRPGHRRTRRNGTTYCPTAGHRRNQQMVDLGAALCVAFHHSDSTGTADCLRRAAAAGIPVHRVTA